MKSGVSVKLPFSVWHNLANLLTGVVPSLVESASTGDHDYMDMLVDMSRALAGITAELNVHADALVALLSNSGSVTDALLRNTTPTPEIGDYVFRKKALPVFMQTGFDCYTVWVECGDDRYAHTMDNVWMCAESSSQSSVSEIIEVRVTSLPTNWDALQITSVNAESMTATAKPVYDRVVLHQRDRMYETGIVEDSIAAQCEAMVASVNKTVLH